jgi:hypothetical protein
MSVVGVEADLRLAPSQPLTQLRQGMPLSVLQESDQARERLVLPARKAPLGSLLVAFLPGVAVARRR